MKLRKEVFEQLIQSLNNYKYCFLRNYQDLPNYNNDIDILINIILNPLHNLSIHFFCFIGENYNEISFKDKYYP